MYKRQGLLKVLVATVIVVASLGAVLAAYAVLAVAFTWPFWIWFV